MQLNEGQKDTKIPFALAFGAQMRHRQKYLFALERPKTKNPRRGRGINRPKSN